MWKKGAQGPDRQKNAAETVTREGGGGKDWTKTQSKSFFW